jgi:hypothetical protein
MTGRVSVGISGVALSQFHRRANYGHKSTLNFNNNYYFIFVPKLVTHSETVKTDHPHNLLIILIYVN